LQKAGWTVIRVWGHEAIDDAADRIERVLRPWSTVAVAIAPTPHESQTQTFAYMDARAFLRVSDRELRPRPYANLGRICGK
jgi:hypothetical protein